jgi:hypothetical protein
MFAGAAAVTQRRALVSCRGAGAEGWISSRLTGGLLKGLGLRDGD